MKNVHIPVIITMLFSLAGCSPMTINTSKQAGGDELDARAIFNLVSGNTLSLTAYDFDGRIYFNEQGKIAGRDNEGQRDTGSWDIKDNDQLCLRFKIWYYGDISCYSVVAASEQDIVSFFTTNGAAYYRGSVQKGDASGLGDQINTEKSSKFVRQSLAEEPSGPLSPQDPPQESIDRSSPTLPGRVDTTSSVRQLAQKCNGCNLSGVDLKEAVLVKAQLEGADLSGADLRYANLRRARLAGANLRGAQLNHANLPGADLRGCDLRGADLTGANLLLADLTDADLSGATLTNAHLENTIGIER